MMKRILLACCILAATITVRAERVVGGDISMLPKYEAKNATYYDLNGKRITNLLPWLKEQGWTAMRVRLFVDPSKAPSDEQGEGVCQDLEYVKTLGARIKAAGFKLMLDFHYSDTWADPAQQTTPDAWKSLTDDELADTMYCYTRRCLQEMIAAGAAPDFIQVGNEISYGLLWGPAGTSNANKKKFYPNDNSTHQRYFALMGNAINACREVCPRAKVIIHTELVRNISMMNNYYRAIANLDYDIIGLSYYPYYHYGLQQLNSAIVNIRSNFPAKEVMIVETGFYHKWQAENINFDYSTTADGYGNTYQISHEGQRAFTQAMVQKLLEYEQVTGIFWWWPEANEKGVNWQNPVTSSGWYNAGLWDNETGRVLPALFELAAFASKEMLRGDLNGDDLVDVTDVSLLIDLVLGKEVTLADGAIADLNGDGLTDVTDVSLLIDLVLGKTE